MTRHLALLGVVILWSITISHAVPRRAAVVIDATALHLAALSKWNEGDAASLLKHSTESAIQTMEQLLSSTNAHRWEAVFDCQGTADSLEETHSGDSPPLASPGTELVPALGAVRDSSPLQGSTASVWHFIGKQKMSCMHNTVMSGLLSANQIDELYVMGFDTEQSVFATVFDIWRSEVVQKVFLVADAVASVNGYRQHHLGIDMVRATVCGDLSLMECPTIVQSASILGMLTPPATGLSANPVHEAAPANPVIVTGRTPPPSEGLAFLRRNSQACDNSWHHSPFIGVNLGGWLVTENWIFPSQMRSVDAGDEWTLVDKLGGPLSSLAQNTMKTHWDTFVTEGDLDRLKAFGVSHLRIPVGYWLLDYDRKDGFVDGGKFYLDRLIGWMKSRCMLAVFDLHALPGGQEAHESFTGKSVDKPYFFLDSSHYKRGKEVVYEMADLLRSYEANDATSGVVVGLSPANEPSLQHWFGESSHQDFYSSVVTTLRDPNGDHYLDPSRYPIYLNYMGRASQMVDWLLTQTWSRSNIVLDKHVYHKFDTKCDLPATLGGLQDSPHLHPGDDHGPKCHWPDESDSCKTCCRDRWFVEPVIASDFPLIVGEWSLATLTEPHITPEFRQKFFKQQLAFYAEIPRMQGSFFWSFKTEEPDQWKEWCLMWLIENDLQGISLSPESLSLASTCPKSLDQCPDFTDKTMENSLWKATCEWQDLPCPATPVSPHPGSVVNSGGKISLLHHNGKVLYVEGEIVRLRCASAGAYQELYIQDESQSTEALSHGDVIHLKANAITWDNSLYYLEIDWDPAAPGKTDLVRATSTSIHAKGAEWTAQAFTVERASGPGLVRSGDIVHLRTATWRLLGGFNGDTVKSVRHEPSHHECFTILTV